MPKRYVFQQQRYENTITVRCCGIQEQPIYTVPAIKEQYRIKRWNSSRLLWEPYRTEYKSRYCIWLERNKSRQNKEQFSKPRFLRWRSQVYRCALSKVPFLFAPLVMEVALSFLVFLSVPSFFPCELHSLNQSWIPYLWLFHSSAVFIRHSRSSYSFDSFILLRCKLITPSSVTASRSRYVFTLLRFQSPFTVSLSFTSGSLACH